MEKKYVTFNLIKFKDIVDWDANRTLRASIRSKYGICKLSECIIEQNQKYEINNPDKDYKILGVNNQIGIFDAYVENGSKINQKYKKMENGWIAYNPYRVNVGSIGIKDSAQQNEYISPAYVVLSCRENLNSEFLYYLMKTQHFNKKIRENTTGTVRQNLSFDILKNFEIPCPVPSIQTKLVSEYKDKILQATLLESKANDVEEQIEIFLSTKLGITDKNDTRSKHQIGIASEPYNEFSSEYRPKESYTNTYFFGQERKKKYKHLAFVNFADLKDWSIEKDDKKNILIKGIYDSIALSDVITLQSGQFLPRNKQVGKKYNVYGGNGITGQHNAYCFEGKRIVIGRVGEYCGNVHLVEGRYWVTDNALIVNKKNNRLSWEYLAIALKMLNLNQYKKQSAQPVISQKAILSLSIQIPPLEIQNEIVSHISKLRAEIDTLKQTAKNLRETAMKEFENEIFE